MKLQSNNPVIRFAFLAVFITALALFTPTSAWAHARLIRSTPGVDTDVAQSPVKIDLWFNELLDNGFNSISVFPASEATNPSRVNLTPDEAQVDPKDRTHLSLAIKPLSPGEYIVEWRVLSLDGHTAPGRFKFRIRASN